MAGPGLRWLEDWKTPGVCLLAQAEVCNRGLLGAIANRLMSPSGIWLLAHGREAALVDAPFSWEDSEPVLHRIREYLCEHELALRFISASHLHLDHSAGLSGLLDSFPEASFIYPANWKRHWHSVSRDRIKYGLQPAMNRQWHRMPSQSFEDLAVVDLEGEPLFFVVAPYHSLTDQLVVFRGCVLLPDWHLPSTPDEPLNLVDAPKLQVVDTLARMCRFEEETGHSIHQSCAVHGDEPVRTDFQHRLRLAHSRFARIDATS